MGDITRYITRPDTTVDDRYLKRVSEMEQDRARRLQEEKKEERRRIGVLKKIFPDIQRFRAVKFISVYDLDGKYEATYAGGASAAKALGVQPHTIWTFLSRENRLQVAGKQLRKTDIAWIDGQPMINRKSIGPAREKRKSKPPVPVSVYDLDGYYLGSYMSETECAAALGLSNSEVTRVINNVGMGGGSRQARGYQFRKAKWLEDWNGGHWDARRIKPYTGKFRMKYIHKEYKRTN